MRYNTAAADVGQHSPFARTTPWREGERFSVAPLEGTGPVTARVVRVVGGRFVLAVVEKDEAGARKVLEQAGAALEFLAAARRAAAAVHLLTPASRPPAPAPASC